MHIIREGGLHDFLLSTLKASKNQRYGDGAFYYLTVRHRNYSIHFHVWEKKDMDELLVYLMKVLLFDFEIELSFRPKDTNENIYILRKNFSDEEAFLTAI